MKAVVFLATVLAGVLLPAAGEGTEEKGVTLKAGDKAPEFEITSLNRDNNAAQNVKLADFKEKKNVLVAFYPKPFSPGCTTQLCGYRDDLEMFIKTDTEAIAVSMDTQAEIDRFKKEKAFRFYAGADPEGKIVKAYGVPIASSPKGNYAKRAVFLIDKTGVIRYVDMNYNVTQSKAALYEAIKKLANP